MYPSRHTFSRMLDAILISLTRDRDTFSHRSGTPGSATLAAARRNEVLSKLREDGGRSDSDKVDSLNIVD